MPLPSEPQTRATAAGNIRCKWSLLLPSLIEHLCTVAPVSETGKPDVVSELTLSGSSP